MLYFGVGLSRKVSGVYRAAIEEWNEHKKKCGAYGVAVDICSGLDAKSGQMLGACVKADVQITFWLWKSRSVSVSWCIIIRSDNHMRYRYAK